MESSVISRKIFSESRQTPLTRLTISEENLAQVLKNDPFDFLVYNFRNFSLGYCQSLMLTIHELWSDFSIRDWQQLFICTGRRPEPKPFELTGIWTDFVFFSGFLCLNPFHLLSRNKNQFNESYSHIISFFRINAPLIFPDINSLKDLDGETFCHLSILHRVTEKLLKEDKQLIRPYQDPDSLREYISRFE